MTNHLRRYLLFPLAIVLSLSLLLADPWHATAAERPNILIILCDDLGYGDLGCYGHPAIKTPHLDQLAAQGIRFTDCYSAAPVCSSSRAGLLTGRTPSRLGIYDWIPAGHPMHLTKEELTIPTLLRKAGYATCHVGKWHVNGKFNSPDQPQPGEHGFDHWMSTQNNAAPSHENPTNFVRNGTPVGPRQGFSCDLVAGEAIRWLKELRDKNKPFFQFVCFHEPHEPIASPAELVAQYPDATKEGQAQYFANVTNMDRAVGKLLQALDDLKLADRTLVFFSSDNGPETLSRYKGAHRSHGSPGPLRGMKLHLYDGGMRVAGILRYPVRVKAGQTSSEPVCSLDLLPTCCELAGIPAPNDRVLDGASFVPLFEGQPIVRATPLYWHYFRSIGGPKAALRDGDWMILGHWDGPQLGPGGSVHAGDCEAIKTAKLTKFELYNLKKDIGETTELAKQEPGKLKELAELLVKKYEEVQKAGRVWEVPSTPANKEK
ncbi:MAG: sulfatase-like hydrolase/transferase [Pirellulaceae bacterium]|nr:sulfatase-like hydrolase/transferase [Pirellulaceae bacterium]